MSFVHLHVHTQYSILDGQSSIENLFARATELGMPALAITDHGNLYGVKEFLKVAKKKEYSSVKPIIGCEIYVSKYDHKIKDKDHRAYYHLILLAKNYNGYKNLMKIVSTGHIEGKYYDKPRVSHEVVEKYAQDLVCCSACIAGEVPRNIMNGDMKAAEKAIQWHKDIFGDDYYLEVQLHKTEVPGQSLDLYERQLEVNEGIFKLAKKTNTKVVASNDIHFVLKEDGPAHDRLICLNLGAYVDEANRLHYTQQEYMKSEEEMAALFPEHPEVISNTLEVAEKIEQYKIDREPILPLFRIPDEFMAEIDKHTERFKDVIDCGKFNKNEEYRGDDFCHSVAYLCHLTYKGAELRYGETLTNEQKERIDFELKTICKMGFPDYFLIVQDFIAAARAEGVSVGPGRGSAAGSVVAYCLKITNLDPIKYQLLFERFLNPDRINMPDIDIDFDDEGRYKAFKYVEDTYGKDHISHVITFGTMAAKSAIKDVARVCRLPIEDSNNLTKLIPDRPFSQMEDAEMPFDENDTLEKGETLIEKEVEIDDPESETGKKTVLKKFKKFKKEVTYKINLKNCYRFVPELKEKLVNGTDLEKEVLNYALKLEGCIRQTGVHACAMIIGRGDLTDYIPIGMAPDKTTGEDLWVSQYDGHFIEDVGMLKMDFLGLRTLSIIKECQANIKKRSGIEFDIEKIPIDDKKTYELYGNGDTTSIFQFESAGMKEWLKKLKPTRFEDLIAMNALYRPGPLDYIPDFVKRKQGIEPVEYDLPEMEEFLSDTYGVTVYQEQVMLLSQKLAGFTKGEADTLRKAMGKKIFELLQSLKGKFIAGGEKNGHPKETLIKIWKDWEKFAQYAFNKSHATCYAWVSYQTAYLKAHYPAEFQAANLSKNLNDMDEIKVIMEDCRKAKIKVMNPDINESGSGFTVNKEGNIRFGLGGIKGFGNNIVSAIIAEREENGNFSDLYDFAERMAGVCNKKALEALIKSGAFDSFGYKRCQYFMSCATGGTFLDALVKFMDLHKNDTFDNSNSLFGDVEEIAPEKPVIPQFIGEEDMLNKLKEEKELVGLYLSSHPLDAYSYEISNFCNCNISDMPVILEECKKTKTPRKVTMAGFVTQEQQFTSQTGKQYMKAIVEDYYGNHEIFLHAKSYEKHMQYFHQNNAIYIEGECIPRPHRPKKDETPAAEKERRENPDYMMVINNCIMLDNLAESKIKQFSITLSTTMLNEGFRKELIKIIKRNKGNIPLALFLLVPEKKWCLEFMSNKFRISINKKFLEELDRLRVGYSFIKK